MITDITRSIMVACGWASMQSNRRHRPQQQHSGHQLAQL